MKIRVTTKIELEVEADSFGEAEKKVIELFKPIVPYEDWIRPYCYENIDPDDD